MRSLGAAPEWPPWRQSFAALLPPITIAQCATMETMLVNKLSSGFAVAGRALSVGLALSLLCQIAIAQQVLIDFRFDPSDPGYNPASPSTMMLVPQQFGATYTIDIWGTVVPATATPSNQLGLQALSLRGISDIVSGQGAFATGVNIGTVNNSFVPLGPFNPNGFTQPKVGDLGSSTNGGQSVTNTAADGILDFGGAITTMKLTFLSNNDAPQLGGGPVGMLNTSTTPNGWEFELGTFRYTIGTALNVAESTTEFSPLLLLPSQAAAQAAAYTVDGGAHTLDGPDMVGSPVSFVVENSISAPEPSSMVLVGIGAVGLSFAALRRTARKPRLSRIAPDAN